ncbi:MAG: hypothetical protein IPL52_10880 [Flavobacteriales bacterium]|nr:hypothetical protein [Flavobacteriales bacterium]
MTGPNNYTSNEQNPTVCAAGTYILTVTGANGCTSQANADVDVDDEAPGAIATGGTLTCTNTCVTLSGSGNGDFARTGPNNYTSNEQNPRCARRAPSYSPSPARTDAQAGRRRSGCG